MLKNILILPDGTEISSGPQSTNAIMWMEETDAVNIGEDLVIGSAYANKLKARILTPHGGLTINAGDEVTLVKEDNGVRTQCGIYVMEKPERSSAHSTQLTGYNRVVNLDKDLGPWLNGLTGWPYRLIDFAAMVCDACGLTLVTKTVPNADFPVPQFFRATVTGRQIMRWIGEICCRFCRATPNGDIELAWYEPSGKTITPNGDYRYLAKSLTYDTFTTEKVDAVQIRLANSTDGALWPSGIGTYGTVTGNIDYLNIRSAAGSGNPAVGRLLYGEKVPIYEFTTVNGQVWGRVAQGWIWVTGYVTLSDKRVYGTLTGNATLNIRSTAGVGGTVVGQLVRGDRVQIFDQKPVSGQMWGRTFKGWVCITGYLTLDSDVRNPYVINGNAILQAKVTEDLIPYLRTIEGEIEDFAYTPCKVSILNTPDIRPGHTVDVTDINGDTIRTIVMSKTTKGQRNTLESTGNPNRESTNAINNKTPAQKAEEAVENQTHEEIFNKLTKNGEIQGIYVRDGKWYINAELAKIVNLIAEKLKSTKTGFDVLNPTNTQTLDIDGGGMELKFNEDVLAWLTTDVFGKAALWLQDIVNSIPETTGVMSGHSVNFEGNAEKFGISHNASLGIDTSTGISYANVLQLNGKTVKWKDNGDGTFTLIGS